MRNPAALLAATSSPAEDVTPWGLGGSGSREGTRYVCRDAPNANSSFGVSSRMPEPLPRPNYIVAKRCRVAANAAHIRVGVWVPSSIRLARATRLLETATKLTPYVWLPEPASPYRNPSPDSWPFIPAPANETSIHISRFHLKLDIHGLPLGVCLSGSLPPTWSCLHPTSNI